MPMGRVPPTHRFVNEMDANTRKLADLTVRFGPGTNLDDRVIGVTFQFGRWGVHRMAVTPQKHLSPCCSHLRSEGAETGCRTEVTATAVDESTGNACYASFKFASA